MAIVSAAGPASNIAMAAVLGFALKQLVIGTGAVALGGEFLVTLLLVTIQLNVVLAVFNMIPVPPLDGFGVLSGFLTGEAAARLQPLRMYGPFILLTLFIVGPLLGVNLLWMIMEPPVVYLLNLILG